MPKVMTVNTVISFAFVDGVYMSREAHAEIETRFDRVLVKKFKSILDDSTSPSEVWTTASSFAEATRKVEPVLRKKYPELTDDSIFKILNYACFTWK
tara:strand:+ start:1973 stop:2263 length:291 start_codon:yes stop_codon:yes gene_type:complete